MTDRSCPRWHQRLHHRMRHSLKKRLVALFVVLALAMTATFLMGMQKALGVGWRDVARPLVQDYVDRLVADIGSPPSVERAQALVLRAPLSVRISGPNVNWQSSAKAFADSDRFRDRHSDKFSDWQQDEGQLLVRTTADGHRIQLGVSLQRWEEHPRYVGWITLLVLLVLTWLAYAAVRRLLRPLDDIRAGAQRFGRGEFAQPIPIRKRDELGDLAHDVNTMAQNIHQMLDAKRGLLLAISHELRSPLTRARLNTELLPDTLDVQPSRDALLRDLGEMRDLITDLLESERLGQGHVALQVEPTDLVELVHEVVVTFTGLGGSHVPTMEAVQVDSATDLPVVALDRTRVRLLLRNLLDNALRHSVGARQGPQVTLRRAEQGVAITVRDYGSGVPDAALPHLAEAFYRPDAARERATGGVGLGLHLCKLVALAHGGSFEVRNAQPGLEVVVVLPG